MIVKSKLQYIKKTFFLNIFKGYFTLIFLESRISYMETNIINIKPLLFTLLAVSAMESKSRIRKVSLYLSDYSIISDSTKTFTIAF